MQDLLLQLQIADDLMLKAENNQPITTREWTRAKQERKKVLTKYEEFDKVIGVGFS